MGDTALEFFIWCFWRFVDLLYWIYVVPYEIFMFLTNPIVLSIVGGAAVLVMLISLKRR